MEEVVRLWSTVSGVAAVVTIAAGVTLALRLRWGHLDTFLSTGWGWAILIGFISTIDRRQLLLPVCVYYSCLLTSC